MSENELKKQAARFFSIYPEKKKLYGTSDGNIFLSRNPAIDHAIKSKPPLKWFEFEKFEKEVNALADINPELQIEEQLKAEALTIDPETAKYADMYRIISGLHLVAESRKAEHVKTAFVNLKVQLEAEADKKAE